MFSPLQEQFYKWYKNLEIRDHRLLYLFLEITRKCNLNCLHCGSDCKSDLHGAELTTESWLRIVDYMAANFGQSLSFVITGGEPLMHSDLDKITRHIKNHKMRWGMVTNGMLLTPERMEKLLESDIYSITLSVDGTESAHNKLRNSPQSFKRVQAALNVISEAHLPQSDVVTCVYPDNLYRLDEIAELLIANGIKAWRLFRIFPSGRAANNPALTLSFEQTQQMLDWIAQNKKKYQQKGLNINLSCEGWLPYSRDKQVRDNPFFCRAGVNIASILADGNITGCSNNHEVFYEGHILRDNFARLWENGFQDFRKRAWLSKTYCSDCQYFKSCQGGSIHLWHHKSGRPEFCYAKDIGRVSD